MHWAHIGLPHIHIIFSHFFFIFSIFGVFFCLYEHLCAVELTDALISKETIFRSAVFLLNIKPHQSINCAIIPKMQYGMGDKHAELFRLIQLKQNGES